MKVPTDRFWEIAIATESNKIFGVYLWSSGYC